MKASVCCVGTTKPRGRKREKQSTAERGREIKRKKKLCGISKLKSKIMKNLS
ncbi:hypothetical protein LOK49_LG08G01240 [Camellia lanceoleosa]|uniref:Uncharacterized protein n=1 Tax=Camellia lanceoleosa TaxID=1840588 RepID=A0ACC0GU00_9ERIC|nr:hypothetical protein LOK49_LG08G01240 [Camellia lanceoleosa]